MKTHTLIILSLCATSILTGCAKIRQMTRRDFAVLNDPFLDAPASGISGAAQLAAAAPVAEADGTAGYAKVGAPQSGNSTTIPPAAGRQNSPFQTAARSRTLVPESTTTELARLASGQPATGASDAAKASEQSETLDMQEMAAFMKQQAEASGMKETAADLEADFEAFAAARQEEWKQKVKQAKQKADGDVRQVVDRAASMGESEMSAFPDMNFDTGFGDSQTAQPLIQQVSGEVVSNASSARASLAEGATQLVQEMPNPFEDQAPANSGSTSRNPFASSRSAAAGAQQGASGSQHKSSVPTRTGTSTSNQALNDFAAFAESQLTGKIQAQPASEPQPNPFAEWPRQVEQSSQDATPVTGPAGPEMDASVPPKKAEKLDDKFRFDVGWRPANMERR